MVNKPDYSFQDRAVNKVFKDFRENPTSKNLLVIPTGGGKTFTAVKVIMKMIKENMISSEKKILWVAHRMELVKQAEDTLKEQKVPSEFVVTTTIKKGSDLLKEENNNIKFVVIDEAHHSAANSYTLFMSNNIGVLGLTATPARNDEKELTFEKTSFSISFRELINRNVILDPRRIEKYTDIEIKTFSLNNNSELEKFNNPQRNQKIAESIIEDRNDFKKVIIFTGTISHAKELYKKINAENQIKGRFSHIGYITSNECEKGSLNKEEREKYLEEHKKKKSSILINAALLNEGYDDPSIDCVVMATPTNSILYYVQCVGRTVRFDKKNPNKKAYIMEFFDDLPNISYRIDNRWLFNELSDELEPAVNDVRVVGKKEFTNKLKKIYSENDVLDGITRINAESNIDEFTLVLFNSEQDPRIKGKHRALLMSSNNVELYSNIFNFLSNFMEGFTKKNYSYGYIIELITKRFKLTDNKYLTKSFLKDIVFSMKSAFGNLPNKYREKHIKIYTFAKLKSRFPEGFEEFIEECCNKDFLVREFDNAKENNEIYLLKFPLPLCSFEGRYLKKEAFDICEDILKSLDSIKSGFPYFEHIKLINEQFLGLKNLPLPIKFLNSLPLIIREGKQEKYYFCIK